MTAELAVEGARIARDLSWIMRQQNVSGEVPIKIHLREVDAGGAPELAPALIRFIGPVCSCGRQAQCAPGCRYWKDRLLGHLADCEPACQADARFHIPARRNHPNRMKRALRQVRRLNPKAYDLVYLVVALHYSLDDARDKINASNLERGKPEMTAEECAVLWVSGGSMLAAAW